MRTTEYVKKIESILEGKEEGTIDLNRLHLLNDLLRPMDETTLLNVSDFVSLYFDREKLIARLNEDLPNWRRYEDYQSAFDEVVFMELHFNRKKSA